MFSGQQPATFTIDSPHGARYNGQNNKINNQNDFIFSDDGNYLKITRITDLIPTMVTINHPFHAIKNFYYEGEMTKGNNGIALGVSPETCLARSFKEGGLLEKYPQTDWDLLIENAWPHFSTYSYHADTGKVWNQGIGTMCGHYLNVNDIVGCGFDSETTHLFFTLNGKKLDRTFMVEPGSIWYPITAFKGEGAELQLNLGNKPFVFPYHLYQPSMVQTRRFPLPESFSEEWAKHISQNYQINENHIYDHLKDVTIVSKDAHEIKCHGLILSIRSKVFQVMLEPTKQGDNTITIKDFDAQTIKKMLLFVYSDKVEEDEVDMDLLGIANMYQLEALQIFCERRMSNDMDVNNVLDAWVGANLFKRDTFLEICETFIIANWSDIQKTEAFSRIMKENCEDIASLLVKMLNVHTDSKKKESIGSGE